MDEIKISTFLTVSECGSFTKASEKLFLSPISVKKQIDSLEAELGETLFIRRATGCTLSPAGEIFVKHAHKILNAIEAARVDVEAQSIKNRGEILAGHSITFNYRFVGSLSTGFSETHSNCIIQFQKYQRDELIDLLENHKINCVFAESTLLTDNKPDIEFYPLVSSPVYAIMSKNHPLSNRKSLSIDDLTDQEIYATTALGDGNIKLMKDKYGNNFNYIEGTDRNLLFNRIVKGAVEIYPRQFSYYSCIPLEIEPITIGIYTARSSPEIIKTMVKYAADFVQNNKDEANEIM